MLQILDKEKLLFFGAWKMKCIYKVNLLNIKSQIEKKYVFSSVQIKNRKI